jgi:hypothetical protein
MVGLTMMDFLSVFTHSRWSLVRLVCTDCRPGYDDSLRVVRFIDEANVGTPSAQTKAVAANAPLR